MRTKQVIALLSAGTLFLTSGISVLAQSPFDSLGDAFERMRQSRIFAGFFERFAAGEPGAIFWSKFLIWLLLFAVLSFGLGSIPRMSKKIANIVAGIIALISVIAIPSTIMLTIFQTYATLTSFVLFLLPIAGIVFLHLAIKKLFENSKVKHLCGAILSLLLLWVTSMMFESIQSLQGASSLGVYAPFLYFLLGIWAIWDIFQFVTGGTGVGAKASDLVHGLFPGGSSSGGASSDLTDLRQQITQLSSDVRTLGSDEQRESIQESRVLQDIANLEQKEAKDMRGIEVNLARIEKSLIALKSSQNLAAKQMYLQQLKNAIQSIIPADAEFARHLTKLKADLGMLVTLERKGYAELGKESAIKDKIEKIRKSHPKYAGLKLKDAVNEFGKLVDADRVKLKKQYKNTVREKKIVDKMTSEFASLRKNIAGIVNAVNLGKIKVAINRARDGQNNARKIQTLNALASKANSLIGRQLKSYQKKAEIIKMLDAM